MQEGLVGFCTSDRKSKTSESSGLVSKRVRRIEIASFRTTEFNQNFCFK